MSGILASVTGIAEARVVLEAGVDILDLKNPAQGALGALPIATIAEIVRFVDSRVPVSATVGDLPMQPQLLCDAAAAVAATGVDIVKIGLFGEDNHETCIRQLGRIADGCTLVAVMFADQNPDISLLPLLAESGFHGAMLDTAEKTGGGLRSWMDHGRLEEFVDAARGYGLLVGLAGALREHDIAPLLPLGADYLGFRGALCARTERTAAISHEKIKAIVQIVAQMQQPVECAG